MNSAEKLRLLRQRMQEQGMDAYVVVTDDFHGSEYVADVPWPSLTMAPAAVTRTSGLIQVSTKPWYSSVT